MTDLVEIAALIVGPTLAVGLTVWADARKATREKKLGVMRQLLLLRSHAGDPGFSHAVNLIPVEFGHSSSVMTAYENFDRAANSGGASNELVNTLAMEMMLDLGYSRRAASQVARSPYVSVALGDQLALLNKVLEGIVSIAESNKISAAAAAAVAQVVVQAQPPPTNRRDRDEP